MTVRCFHDSLIAPLIAVRSYVLFVTLESQRSHSVQRSNVGRPTGWRGDEGHAISQCCEGCCAGLCAPRTCATVAAIKGDSENREVPKVLSSTTAENSAVVHILVRHGFKVHETSSSFETNGYVFWTWAGTANHSRETGRFVSGAEGIEFSDREFGGTGLYRPIFVHCSEGNEFSVFHSTIRGRAQVAPLGRVHE